MSSTCIMQNSTQAKGLPDLRELSMTEQLNLARTRAFTTAIAKLHFRRGNDSSSKSVSNKTWWTFSAQFLAKKDMPLLQNGTGFNHERFLSLSLFEVYAAPAAAAKVSLPLSISSSTPSTILSSPRHLGLKYELSTSPSQLPSNPASHGAVSFLNSSPSTLALLSAVAGSLNDDPPVPNFTLTPPDPTFTFLASALSRSADPGGSSGRGKFALTRSIFSSSGSCSFMSCYETSELVGCLFGLWKGLRRGGR